MYFRTYPDLSSPFWCLVSPNWLEDSSSSSYIIPIPTGLGQKKEPFGRGGMTCDQQILYYQTKRKRKAIYRRTVSKLQTPKWFERKSTATWLITCYETHQWVEVYFPVVALGRSCFSKRSSLSLNLNTNLCIIWPGP